MSAQQIIDDARAQFAGDPVFLAGSVVSELVYLKQDAHCDVDLFVPTSQVLIASGQKLLNAGFTFAPRFDRVWARWMRYGFKSWHTNSLKMLSPTGCEYNLVYKLTEGHAATSLAEVIESFDFGLLGAGWDMENDCFRDMRSYLFPTLDPAGPLPLMPNKRVNWRNGFISKYNGMREAGRYAKYAGYGYDMSRVKDDLTTGYYQASSYLQGHFEPEQQQLGLIYDTIARHIDADNIDHLTQAYKQLNFKDELDKIMEALE